MRESSNAELLECYHDMIAIFVLTIVVSFEATVGTPQARKGEDPPGQDQM